MIENILSFIRPPKNILFFIKSPENYMHLELKTSCKIFFSPLCFVTSFVH